MVLDDIKKIFDALVGQLSPEKAQGLAKRYLGQEPTRTRSRRPREN